MTNITESSSKAKKLIDVDGGFLAMPFYIRVSPLISRTAKDIYELLLHYFQGDAYCYPGQERIALDLQLSDRQVRRGLKELKQFKLLKWQKRGYAHTNIYVPPKEDDIKAFIEESKKQYLATVDMWKAEKNLASDRTPMSTLKRTPVSTLDRTPMSAQVEAVLLETEEVETDTKTDAEASPVGGVQVSSKKKRDLMFPLYTDSDGPYILFNGDVDCLNWRENRNRYKELFPEMNVDYEVDFLRDGYLANGVKLSNYAETVYTVLKKKYRTGSYKKRKGT